MGTEEETEKLITIISNPRQYKIPDWFLNRQKDVVDGKYSQVLSNALDNKLREDLERLKKIRIVFKTPKYRDVEVAHDVGVFFELYRPSDGAVSDPKAFRYKPSGKTRLGKRARFEAPFAIRSRPLPLAGTLTNE